METKFNFEAFISMYQLLSNRWGEISEFPKPSRLIAYDDYGEVYVVLADNQTIVAIAGIKLDKDIIYKVPKDRCIPEDLSNGIYSIPIYRVKHPLYITSSGGRSKNTDKKVDAIDVMAIDNLVPILKTHYDYLKI